MYDKLKPRSLKIMLSKYTLEPFPGIKIPVRHQGYLDFLH